jgi:hypothetical protein
MTLQQWIKCFLITDQELKPLPAKLVHELGRKLQVRWINLNRAYYQEKGTQDGCLVD